MSIKLDIESSNKNDIDMNMLELYKSHTWKYSMSGFKAFCKLNQFLKEHKVYTGKITHTSMDYTKGAFYIVDNDLLIFNKLYYNAIRNRCKT